KDLARARRVEHAKTDESAVERLVAGAPARDERYLATLRRALADDDLRRRVIAKEVGVRGGQAGKRFLDDIRRVVEELAHLVGFDCHSFSPWCASARQRRAPAPLRGTRLLRSAARRGAGWPGSRRRSRRRARNVSVPCRTSRGSRRTRPRCRMRRWRRRRTGRSSKRGPLATETAG